MGASNRMNLNLSAAAASITTACVLVALKGWAEWSTGSLSVATSLLDSALDLIASLGNLGAMIYAARPADDDHRFGHSSAEDLAALAQSILVIGAAGAIFWAAVSRLGAPRPLENQGQGAALMIASLALTGALIWWQGRVAARTGSKVVEADRAHYLSDFVPGLSALAALAGSLWLGVEWLDPVLGIMSAGFVLITGLSVGRGALHRLMDREAPPETVAEIKALADSEPGVLGWHDLKTRMSGTRLFVQVHIEIDPNVTLREAHARGAALRRRIIATGPEVECLIHFDPASED